MQQYVNVNGQLLRRGFTTGTCACAALKACILWTLYDKKDPEVSVRLNEGSLVNLKIESYEIMEGKKYAFIRKDAGDDSDITNHCLIYVSYKATEPGTGFVFTSAEGVGLVTKKGLDVRQGEYAINPGPRKMMKSVLQEYGINDAIITVNVKDGQKIAIKTLNSSLGIVGGISILGTSGIVEPMSEEAWKESLVPQIRMIGSYFTSITLLSGGKSRKIYETSTFFKNDFLLCGNFFGFSIEKAIENHIKTIHIMGSFQKIIKLAGLNLNTDSRLSDSKNELLALMYIMFKKNYDEEMVKKILSLNPIYNIIELFDEHSGESKAFFEFCGSYIAQKLEKRFNQPFIITLCEKESILSHTGGLLYALHNGNTD